jgi:hypothetical protein
MSGNVTTQHGKMFSTGLALPSTMKTYLDNRTYKQYALWSPHKFGHMATYLGILPSPGTNPRCGPPASGRWRHHQGDASLHDDARRPSTPRRTGDQSNVGLLPRQFADAARVPHRRWLTGARRSPQLEIIDALIIPKHWLCRQSDIAAYSASTVARPANSSWISRRRRE